MADPRLSGEDHVLGGGPTGNPLDSLVGLIPEGNVEHGNVKLLVELATVRGRVGLPGISLTLTFGVGGAELILQGPDGGWTAG